MPPYHSEPQKCFSTNLAISTTTNHGQKLVTIDARGCGSGRRRRRCGRRGDGSVAVFVGATTRFSRVCLSRVVAIAADIWKYTKLVIGDEKGFAGPSSNNPSLHHLIMNMRKLVGVVVWPYGHVVRRSRKNGKINTHPTLRNHIKHNIDTCMQCI